MPASKQRAIQVSEAARIHGDEYAMQYYAITAKTLANYRKMAVAPYPTAKAKENPKQDTILQKLKAKFTDEQLESLLKANNTTSPRIVPEISFEGDEVSILLVSDTHVGSVFFDESRLMAAFEEGKKQGCQLMMHTGDVCEGMSGRPGQVYELTEIGHTAQVNKAAELFNRWDKPMFFCTGNHDFHVNSKAGVGIDVGKELESKIANSHNVGHNEGIVVVNGAKFMLYHGEDGSSYAHSYRAQKIIEAFTGGEKPQVLLLGHVHKMIYMMDRNVHAVSAGCIERQSSFMRYKRLAAHCGFWILKCKIKDGEVKQFTPTWYPFYE